MMDASFTPGANVHFSFQPSQGAYFTYHLKSLSSPAKFVSNMESVHLLIDCAQVVWYFFEVLDGFFLIMPVTYLSYPSF